MSIATRTTLARGRAALGLAPWIVLLATTGSVAADADCATSDCHENIVAAFERSEAQAAVDDGDRSTARTHLHGPVGQRQCTPCHPAHSIGQRPASLLRGAVPRGSYARYTRSAYSACFESCHSATLVEEASTATATRFRNGDDNLHYRHVAKLRRGRACKLCHAPHEARNRALIRDYMPFGAQRLTLKYQATDGGGKCTTSCHIPVEYSREEAIASPMRVVEPGLQ